MCQLSFGGKVLPDEKLFGAEAARRERSVIFPFRKTVRLVHESKKNSRKIEGENIEWR